MFPLVQASCLSAVLETCFTGLCMLVKPEPNSSGFTGEFKKSCSPLNRTADASRHHRTESFPFFCKCSLEGCVVKKEIFFYLGMKFATQIGTYEKKLIHILKLTTHFFLAFCIVSREQIEMQKQI